MMKSKSTYQLVKSVVQSLFIEQMTFFVDKLPPTKKHQVFDTSIKVVGLTAKQYIVLGKELKKHGVDCKMVEMVNPYRSQVPFRSEWRLHARGLENQ